MDGWMRVEGDELTKEFASPFFKKKKKNSLSQFDGCRLSDWLDFFIQFTFSVLACVTFPVRVRWMDVC